MAKKKDAQSQLLDALVSDDRPGFLPCARSRNGAGSHRHGGKLEGLSEATLLEAF